MDRAGFQVPLTRLVKLLFCFILVAKIRSSVSLRFTVRSHLFSISLTVRDFPWITRSHRRTQMRWRDSDSKICRSREAPMLLCQCGGVLFWGGFMGKWMEPQPRRIPRFRSGQWRGECGHRFLASRQMVWGGPAWQCRRMCSIDLRDSQWVHIWRSWRPGIWDQKGPIFWVPCIALKRN